MHCFVKSHQYVLPMCQSIYSYCLIFLNQIHRNPELTGDDLFNADVLTNYRELPRTNVPRLTDLDRKRLGAMVDTIIRDVQDKLVVPINMTTEAGSSLIKTTTAALDIIPEMFSVERELYE